jgi:hypothetical protein
MALYETTFFSQQKSRVLALAALRPKINEQLSRLKTLSAFGGETPVVSTTAKNAITGACGNPQTANAHVYETGISGHWRIFFAQGVSGGVVALCVGHLNGNTLQLP